MMEGSANGHHHHHPPPHHRHHNHNRALQFRVPRHNYNGNGQHPQRNYNAQHSSTSHGKNNPPHLKFSHKSDSGSGYTERGGKASRKQERIRSNRLVIDVVSGDSMKMMCRLCSATTTDNTVVAVLVCGHIYHADCLETRTSYEDRRDPPCPLCISSHIAN